MDGLRTVDFVNLITAILVFLAAAIPLARSGYSRYSASPNKPKLLTSIYGYSSTILYLMGFVIWLTHYSNTSAILVILAGWFFRVVAYLLEEDKVKGATLSLVISTVALAMVMQLSLLRDVIDIQSQLVESLTSQASGTP